MKPLFGAIGAVAALGIGGGAYAATAGSPSHSAGTTVSPPTTAVNQAATGRGKGGSAARPRLLALLRGADHASVEVKSKGHWVTYDADRGSVSAVSPTSITLARPDGQSVTFTIGPATKFKRGQSASSIPLHQTALVVSESGGALDIRPAGKGSTGTGSSGTGSTGTGSTTPGSTAAG